MNSKLIPVLFRIISALSVVLAIIYLAKENYYDAFFYVLFAFIFLFISKAKLESKTIRDELKNIQ